jgi:beta-lactam-binding protein with PASTA domain
LEEGTIVSQTPPFGYRVDEGDSIDLVVSIKSPEAKRKIPRFTMIRYSTPEGFYPKRVRIVVIDDRGTHEVYNQVVKPGEEIEVTTKVVGEATAKIYVSGELMEERILR